MVKRAYKYGIKVKEIQDINKNNFSLISKSLSIAETNNRQAPINNILNTISNIITAKQPKK